MKRGITIVAVALDCLLAGCSTPVTVGTVGPNPANPPDESNRGQLIVYSALVGHTEGNNPTWYQHRSYVVTDQKGNAIMHITNQIGKYDPSPETVTLKPGKYIVKTESQDYLQVEVPVKVERGQTTRVHLDDTWKPANSSKSELVTLPGGTPVGWSINGR